MPKAAADCLAFKMMDGDCVRRLNRLMYRDATQAGSHSTWLICSMRLRSLGLEDFAGTTAALQPLQDESIALTQRAKEDINHGLYQ
jgi:hypothetical protein